MLEMKITITAEDVVIAAINNLAKALEKAEPHTVFTQNGENNTQIKNAAANPTPAPTAPAQAPGAPLSATPAQTGAPVAHTVPVAAPAPTVTPVPTAAPQYTLEMIATAGSALIDAGKLDQLMALLGKFGVDSLTNLDPKHYGTIAMELRALGAKI